MKTDSYMPKESNILYGKDLQDVTKAKIVKVSDVTFTNDDGTVRNALSLEVESLDNGFEGNKSFALGARTVEKLTEKLGNETDKWIGKEVSLSPVPSQTPKGQPTTSIAVTVSNKK